MSSKYEFSDRVDAYCKRTFHLLDEMEKQGEDPYRLDQFRERLGALHDRALEVETIEEGTSIAEGIEKLTGEITALHRGSRFIRERR